MGPAPALLAFSAGVVSFLSPYVVPVVPRYLSSVTGLSFDELADPERRKQDSRPVLGALLFVAGFSTVFVALGGLATALGAAADEALPTLRRMGGVLLVLFGLSFVGVIQVPLLMRESYPRLASQVSGWAGALVAGVAFGCGWTPCVGPVLTSMLLFAGIEATVPGGALLLGMYALGLGLPFVLAAAWFPRFPNVVWAIRRWLLPVERATGLILLVVGFLLVTGDLERAAAFLTPPPALSSGFP